MEGRPEHHVKEMASVDADFWRKKPLAAKCLAEIPTAYVGHVSIANNRDHRAHAEASGMTVTSLSGKDVGETLTLILDPSDTQFHGSQLYSPFGERDFTFIQKRVHNSSHLIVLQIKKFALIRT